MPRHCSPDGQQREASHHGGDCAARRPGSEAGELDLSAELLDQHPRRRSGTVHERMRHHAPLTDSSSQVHQKDSGEDVANGSPQPTAHQRTQNHTQSTMKKPLDTIRRRWIAGVVRIVDMLGDKLGRFTAEDVRQLMLHSKPGHPNWWGVAFAQMVIKKMIKRVGRKVSLRHSSNGRVLTVWRAI